MKKILFMSVILLIYIPCFSKNKIQTYMENIFEEEDGADYYPEEDQFVGIKKKNKILRKKIITKKVSLEEYQKLKTRPTNKEEDYDFIDNEEEYIEREHNKELTERIDFPVVEYNRLKKEGKNSVTGTLYIKGINGDLFLAKDARIFLNPKTTYSQQWYVEVIQRKNRLTPADKRLYNYLTFSTSAKDGTYSMNLVPDGTYYISFSAVCHKRCGNKKLVKYYGAVEFKINGDNKKTISMTLNRY